MTFHGAMQIAVAEARSLIEQGNRVAFFAPSMGELERLADILQEYSIPFQLGIEPGSVDNPYLASRVYHGAVASTYLIKGDVAHGSAFPDSQVVFIGHEDLFETSAMVPKQAPSKAGLAAFAADIADLQPGDYVVHSTHGIGKFLGLRTISQGENQGDFMLVEYAADSKLYVPLTRLDLIQKYRGAGDVKPQLDRLGGLTWTRTKTRVKARMRDMPTNFLSSTRSAAWLPVSRSARTRTGSASSKTLLSSRPPRTRLRRVSRSSAIWKTRRRWIACCAATSDSARQK